MNESAVSKRSDRGQGAVLRMESLRVSFLTRVGMLRAVDGVTLEVRRGETLGIVGESGCGKSVTALSILRLLPTPPARISGGPVDFDGKNLLDLPERDIRRIRGNRISMIFQEPMSSLTPVLTIGRQIREVILLHHGFASREANERAAAMLDLVRISEPRKRLEQYPHELSGGMRQRVMIAMALACRPEILIADEPTTALDVTIQAQILDLINELKEKTGTAVMMITHDLGVVAETAQRVMVMYAGRVVEEAEVKQLFADPLHPYTRGLLASLPRLGSSRGSRGRNRLTEIPGTVPSLVEVVPGCLFAPRCPLVREICRRQVPEMRRKEKGHRAACWALDPGAGAVT
jgi:peptide/nickel transport system ATP-binding protein